MKKAADKFLLPFVLAFMLVAGCTRDSEPLKKAASSDDPAASRRISNRTPDGLKVIRLPLDSPGPTTLDPAQGSRPGGKTMRCRRVYEPLLQYSYVQRPFELEPLAARFDGGDQRRSKKLSRFG
jgi:hypothetical protein